MPPSLKDLGPRRDETRSVDRRAAWSSSALSLLLHGLLFIGMAIFIKTAPHGTGLEETRSVGVVLKHESNGGEAEFYQDESTAADTSSQTASTNKNPLDDAQTIRPADALPTANDILGLNSASPQSSVLPGASGLLSGARSTLSGLPGGRARTQVFGLPAEGFKFVYVFDRSASMSGRGARSPLNRAKVELLASLEGLGPTHQFQIIFYNDLPVMFDLPAQRGKLIFANEPNKRQAQQFIDGIVADGGTEREPALLAALSLAPDVIFFLGDSDPPELTPGQLAKISTRNRRSTVINTIEFGSGPSLRENFLVRLARQNGGAYTYVDISKPVPSRPF